MLNSMYSMPGALVGMQYLKALMLRVYYIFSN